LLDHLLNEPALHTLLATDHAPRGTLKQAAEDALTFLRGFRWQDEGILDSRGTGFITAHKRRASLHLDRVVGVLAWHLREGTTGTFDRRVALAELIAAFWPVRRRRSKSGVDPIAFEMVKKRLQRSDKDFNRRFVVTVERVKFHDLHRFLAVTLDDQRLMRCGTACPPGPDDLNDPLSQGKILMESPRSAPVQDDQESRRQGPQEGTGDPPRFELRFIIHEPPETGPSQRSPADPPDD
jgi:hypothetical protein